MPLVDWLEENPRVAKIFNEANAIKAASTHSVIVDAYDFSGIDILTDVGGGLGILILEILTANSLMKGIVADTYSVIQETNKMIKLRGFGDRCQTLAFDFFKNIPPGSDAYLMSNILHDWSDEQCRIILKNCKHAMKKESRLLVVEMIVPLGNEPSVAKLLDLEMFVMTWCGERTEAEFKDLFKSSGFKLSRIIPTKENICIIEGFKL